MKVQQSRSLLPVRGLSVAWCLSVMFLPWSVTSLSSNSEIMHATGKGIGPKDGAAESRIFSPRMNYEEWTPLGKGDPLKNNPTFDYVPPVLDRVQYWVEPRETTETSAAATAAATATATAKRDILVLGVTAKRTSPKVPERVFQLIDGPKLGKNHHNGEQYTKSFTGSTGAEPPKLVRATNFRYTPSNVPPSQTTKVQFQTMSVKTPSQPSQYYPPETSGNKLTGLSHQTIDATIADGGVHRPPRIIPQFVSSGISSATLDRFAITTPVPRRGSYLSQLPQLSQAQQTGGSSAVASPLSSSYPSRDPNENKRNAMTSVSLEKSNLIYQSTQTISGGWLINTVSDLPDPSILRPSIVGQSSDEHVQQYDQYENDHHAAASSNHQVRVLGHIGEAGQVHDRIHPAAIDAPHYNNLTEIFIESTMPNANDSLTLSDKDDIVMASETHNATKEEDASKKNEKCSDEVRTTGSKLPKDQGFGEPVSAHLPFDKMHIVVANSTSQNHPPEEDSQAGRTSPVAIVMATKYRADGADPFPSTGTTVPPTTTGSPSSSGSPIASASGEAAATSFSIVPPTETVPPSSLPISFSSISDAESLPAQLTAPSAFSTSPTSLVGSVNSQDVSSYAARYPTNTMNLVAPVQTSVPPQPAHRLPMKTHSLPALSSRHPSPLYTHSNPNPNLHSYLHSPPYSHSHMHPPPHPHSHLHQQSPKHYLLSQMQSQPHSRLPGPVSLHFNPGMHPAGPIPAGLRPAPAITPTIASSMAMVPPQPATMMANVPKPLSVPMLMSIPMGHVSPPMAHVHAAGPRPFKAIPPIRAALGIPSSEIEPSPPQDPSDSAGMATVIKASTWQRPSGAQSQIHSALPPSTRPVISTSVPAGVPSSSSADPQSDFRFPLIATTNTPESSNLAVAIDDRPQSERIDQSSSESTDQSLGKWTLTAESEDKHADGIVPGINSNNAQNGVEVKQVNRIEGVSNETITPLRERETTTSASLTTDPIFSHYKQPAKPIRGPMYLIIQGHSKVKTYKPSWVDKTPTNVPGLSGENNEIGASFRPNANEREYLSNLDRYVRNNTKKRTGESANLPATGMTKPAEKLHTKPVLENKASSLMALVERGFDLDSSARLPISAGSSSETGGPTSPTVTVT